MGVLANAKQFLARKAVSAAKKAGDGIATLSSLSPKQLQEIDDKRRAYLADKPDMTGEEARSMIRKNMGAIGIEVYQAYLQQLGTIYSPVDAMLDDFDEDNRIRFFEITKWVRDSEEKSLDKLVNVYHVLSEEDCNIALIYQRTKDNCRVYIGVANTNERWSEPAIADKYYSRVIGAIRGNFPGTDIREMNSQGRDYGAGIPECLKNIYDDSAKGGVKSVAVVSNVASEKSEDFVSQSMEKLLDGIVPADSAQEYTMVLLAKPVRNQLENKNRLYELYTALAPYASWQTGYTYNESNGISSSANFGVNLGVGAGIHSVVNLTAGTSNIHMNQGEDNGFPVGTNEAKGVSSGFNASVNFGVSFARSSNVTAQIGKNESITQTYTNYGVKHTLEVIDSQLRRIEESAALGMWEFASYVISASPVVANNVAHMYLALTQGEKSYISDSAISFWDGDIEADAARTILASVQKLQHPVFGLKPALEDEWLMYPTLVTPTTPLSGKELAKALNFPRKSVSGLPVLEVVPFGREPHSLLDITLDLEVGCGYHMRKRVPEQRIALSKQELTKHTFITGSTGAGKTNAIYKIIDSLAGEKVTFLVVEPAKGEYKDVLGKRKGVTAYGTNPLMEEMELLKINPFRFPDSIHVLEHMDRLVEIFNVCWPMYAAMPAILKDSVERAYVAAGWDLENSQNKHGEKLFPSFGDVVKEIRKVLAESDYSDDNKGDYTGSLVTRLKSLTNGINGLIFSCDDLDDEALFDRNVIVDLSRVGSSETKSLIMGILVLKLQEHRMDQRTKDSCPGQNSELRHITVLEEAHNLLRKTSFEQSGESSNLVGKSVEMLSNSIAEMRTYGEGFIIADQSPGLLDLSVIRNTNTKIIMKLSDYSDRELVGRAAGLNDDQIVEISRFERGAASITQSDWLEPVLCMIDEYQHSDEPLGQNSRREKKKRAQKKEIEKSLLKCIMCKEIYRKGDRVDIRKLRESVIHSKIDVSVKGKFLEYVDSEKDNAAEKLRQFVYEFFDAGKAMDLSGHYGSIEEWSRSVAEELKPSVRWYSNRQIDLLLALLLNERTIRDEEYQDVWKRFTEVFKRERGLL